ncbi:MAG: hypothetical protein D6748_10950 [Calditrichaeota bacterium]|nr:MAG: hypothetical protein D6748_10950 [Calditrichota bacterium]
MKAIRKISCSREKYNHQSGEKKRLSEKIKNPEKKKSNVAFVAHPSRSWRFKKITAKHATKTQRAQRFHKKFNVAFVAYPWRSWRFKK